MKLPAFLLVSPYKWRLVRTTKTEHNEAGYCDTEKREIGVATDLSGDEEEASTLIHEWVHGVIHIHFPEVEDDEALTQKLELIVMQGFRHNKTAIRAILKALK